MTVCAKQVSRIQCPNCKKMVMWGHRGMHKCCQEALKMLDDKLTQLEKAGHVSHRRDGYSMLGF